jgi:hypothetical protein
MEHSEEYYKMKYFKYKAKYEEEKLRQQGGATFTENVVAGASAIGNTVVAGASAIGSRIKSGLSSITQVSTKVEEVKKAIFILNIVFLLINYNSSTNIDILNNNFTNYIKNKFNKNDKISIDKFKQELDAEFFTKLSNVTDEKHALIELKTKAYKKLNKECTPYIGKDIQQSCIDIFKS